MQLTAKDTLLFIGDSITDAGRARPLGQTDGGLGDGYVRLVNSLLGANHPETPIRVLNTGIGGNRITDLEQRWQKDVFDLNPDWLSILIGINDVWRQFDSPKRKDQVDIALYETLLRKLIKQTQPKLKGLVLMAPFYLEANISDPMRTMMDAYAAVVKKLADEYSGIYVNLPAAFDRYLAQAPANSISDDRVHPNQIGHLIIAKAFYQAIGGQSPSDTALSD